MGADLISGAFPAVIDPKDLGPIAIEERIFQCVGAGTLTATITIPPGAYLLRLLLLGLVLWDSAVSAAISVGDDDGATGWANALDLTVLFNVGRELPRNFEELLNAGAGTFDAGSNGQPGYKLYQNGGTITAVTTAVGAGTAGRTRLVAIYLVPQTSKQAA